MVFPWPSVATAVILQHLLFSLKLALIMSRMGLYEYSFVDESVTGLIHAAGKSDSDFEFCC